MPIIDFNSLCYEFFYVDLVLMDLLILAKLAILQEANSKNHINDVGNFWIYVKIKKHIAKIESARKPRKR